MVYSLFSGIRPDLQAHIEPGRRWRVSTYWLGAAQREAGGSWPVGMQRSLPPMETARGVLAYVNLLCTYTP